MNNSKWRHAVPRTYIGEMQTTGMGEHAKRYACERSDVGYKVYCDCEVDTELARQYPRYEAIRIRKTKKDKSG
eukprot:6199827-Pleurochrysis_carterae.AAC.2